MANRILSEEDIENVSALIALAITNILSIYGDALDRHKGKTELEQEEYEQFTKDLNKLEETFKNTPINVRKLAKNILCEEWGRKLLTEYIQGGEKLC